VEGLGGARDHVPLVERVAVCHQDEEAVGVWPTRLLELLEAERHRVGSVRRVAQEGQRQNLLVHLHVVLLVRELVPVLVGYCEITFQFNID